MQDIIFNFGFFFFVSSTDSIDIAFCFFTFSRSQCVINIRSVANHSSEEDDFSANNAVLSIIDLAGAEREKKTGNQVPLYFPFL